MKTAELTGVALEYCVIRLEHPQFIWGEDFGIHYASNQIVIPSWKEPECYSPYSGWAKCGPIIEREGISVHKNLGGSWRGTIRHTEPHPLVPHPVLAGWTHQHGQTPLIAAMRCYVASKLGDEVKVPDELL